MEVPTCMGTAKFNISEQTLQISEIISIGEWMYTRG